MTIFREKWTKLHSILQKFGILAFSYNHLNGTYYSSDFQHQFVRLFQKGPNLSWALFAKFAFFELYDRLYVRYKKINEIGAILGPILFLSCGMNFSEMAQLKVGPF